MPVTIGTVNSNLNLVDSNGTFNEAMMERIIQAVMARLKQEMYDQEKSRSEGDTNNSRTM